MPELSALKTLANLGVAAVVVAMAFYMFYKLFNKFMDNVREDNRHLIDGHKTERAEWREQHLEINKSFASALEKHAESTTLALEKVITEIQQHHRSNQ